MLDQDDMSAALARVARPLEAARGLPNSLYNQADSLELERRKLFNGGWAAIGFAHDAREPGDAFPITHLGQPLLMVRDKAGVLRVFENVCRHRGMILVAEPRNFGGVIRCPYHSWCYSHDGALRATPHVGGAGINAHTAIDPATTGLTEIPSATYLGVVFADLSRAAGPFEAWIAPLTERWADVAGLEVHPAGGFTLVIEANWKLAVENYCESYHLPFVHPGLNSYSRLEDHYHIEAPGTFSGQGTRVYAPDLGTDEPFPDFPDLSEKWDRNAEYVGLYPNVLLGLHRDHTFAILLAPESHERTRERVEIFYTTAE
ncbi:MAG: aromatic ring-hydroxylating dioxygenase subunit alpha, partial [Pseudomonadota bacterium]